ncbi:pyridoxal kinase [Flammeovirga kamogawensis]|uniref:pyridoxal kinase n=1 Tax=Flammeovirga kamogawensis TaxID=373891 RepID=A0ABX8H1Y9_9BACT|nr:pyridoxal kinase [Flammeovirga kamogawensis]MBB6462555.1 pyridoxine kinase [Flammeovirga kamogawensis]QWG09694.1 pyridoxal kinase [Flammeovirga kamogawensis]TRX65206.1 pyridoxal kinase [Flammeovirga kamogawensis]
MKNILSIQSHVTYGHVGNAAAVFPLQFSGHEVWALNTVQFSGHTQYPKWTGQVFTPAHLKDILEGVFYNIPKTDCDAILAGYLGSKGTGEVVYDIVRDIKDENPNAIFCCDTVMGDKEAGFYIAEDVPPLYKDKIITIADIITPNQFEAEFLSNSTIKTLEDAKKVAKSLFEQGPTYIIITSLEIQETPENNLTILLYDGNDFFSIHNPKINLGEVYGTGDVFAAMILSNFLKGDPIVKCLEKTVTTMFNLIKATAEKNKNELDLIGSRRYFEVDKSLFKAEKV